MEPCIYSSETNIPSSGTGEIDVRCNCRFKIDRKGRSKFSKRGESPSGKRYPYSKRGPPFVSNRIIRIIGALLRFFRERAEDRGERVISPFKHWGKRNNILASSRKRHRYRSNNRVVCVSRRFLLCGIRFAGVGGRGEERKMRITLRVERKEKKKEAIYIYICHASKKRIVILVIGSHVRDLIFRYVTEGKEDASRATRLHLLELCRLLDETSFYLFQFSLIIALSR